MGSAAVSDLSLMGKFLNFIKKISGKKQAKSIEVISRFRMILDELNRKDPSYKTAENVVLLCEEGVRVARQRLVFAEKIRGLEAKVMELDAYSKLDDQEAATLKNLLDRFVALSKERSGLMYQITSFDNSLTYMDKLEEEANAALGDIHEAENKQRILKHDLGYLTGEKAELEYEKDFLGKGLNFIYKFTIFIIAVFAVVAVILGYLYMFRNVSIFFPLSVYILLLILVVFLLRMFRRRIMHELQVNVKKQQRAVELLNTKNAVFAHYTNFLNYEYKKYKVRNSAMLKNNLKDLSNYKHLTQRFDNIRNIMYQTEAQIEEFLRQKNLGGVKSTVEQFAQTVNVDDKRQYYREIIKEREILAKNLSDLDDRHEEIWDELSQFDRGEGPDGSIEGRIIQAYLDEVSRLFSL